MSESRIPPSGISNVRQKAVQLPAVTIISGLDALALLADGDEDATVPADVVRWFVEKMREDIDAILSASDGDEEEPEVQWSAGAAG